MNKKIDYIKKYLPESEWNVAIDKIEKGISPQYVVGNVNFYGNVINVDNRVLIPRFETELLVEKTIIYIKNLFDKQVKVLDMGTGSGCIAISLKKEISCDVTASDLSPDALNVAILNSERNNVNINFVLSDLFSNINDTFDVIISNPPYISYNEEIEEIVKNNEPHLALYASDDGYYYYKSILNKCKNYLNDKFLIAFEIGFKQAKNIVDMAYKYLGDSICVNVEKDYSNKDRFVFIFKK